MFTTSQYTCTIAGTKAEIVAAQALRFEVFNLELDEGLDGSYLSKLDQDQFDPVCQHLIVRDEGTGDVVGTYRFQTGIQAQENLGYYSGQEFDLQRLEPHREHVLELGRACIHRDHRNVSVLNLLWKEIAKIAKVNSLRYLIGCSSLTSQDPAFGLATYEFLKANHLVDPDLQTPPHPEFACQVEPGQAKQNRPPKIKIPKLLSAYLALGAKIGGAPAIDREFRTIDFLTILDLTHVPQRVWRRFLT